MINITVRNKDNSLRESFTTSASSEDIKYCICVNANRQDLIRKHDRHKITSNIGWVSYHLRRAGFEVMEKVANKPSYVIVVDELDIM